MKSEMKAAAIHCALLGASILYWWWTGQSWLEICLSISLFNGFAFVVYKDAQPYKNFLTNMVMKYFSVLIITIFSGLALLLTFRLNWGFEPLAAQIFSCGLFFFGVDKLAKLRQLSRSWN